MERTRRGVTGLCRLQKGIRKSHTAYSNGPCLHKNLGLTFQSAVLCACFLPKVRRVHGHGHKGASAPLRRRRGHSVTRDGGNAH